MAETHGEDYKRNDIGNTVHNLESFVTRLMANMISFAGEPSAALGYVLRGLNDGLKNGDGNFVNDLAGALAGATNGLIDAVHREQAEDSGRNLSGKWIKFNIETIIFFSIHTNEYEVDNVGL